MESNAELREAAPEDQPGLDIVRRQAIEMGFSGTYERNQFADLVAQPDPRLPEWIQDEDKLVLVVTDELTPFAYGVYDTEEHRILGLYTGETYRQEGHASRILQAFEEHARSHNASAIRVNSPRNAVEFFAKLGYRKKGTTPSPRCDIILQSMVKRLG